MLAVITAKKSSEDMLSRCCNTEASELPSAAHSLNTGISVLIRGVHSEIHFYDFLVREGSVKLGRRAEEQDQGRGEQEGW